MALFEVVVEEETTGLQHRTIRVEAEDADEAWQLVCEGEGETVSCEDVDTYGANGSSCELISVEEL